MSKTNLILIAVVIALAITLGVVISKYTSKFAEKDNLIESLGSTVKTWKDKDSISHSKIAVLQTQELEDFLRIQTADSTVTNLQELISDYKKRLKHKGSATIIESSTNVVTTSPTVVYYDSTSYSGTSKTKPSDVMPIYSSNFNLKGWVIGEVIASEKETKIEMSIKNKYSLVIGEEKQGLFKKRKPFAEVTNENPYTRIKTLRTYQISKSRVKRIGIGPFFGVDTNLEPTLGFGVTYTILRL